MSSVELRVPGIGGGADVEVIEISVAVGDRIEVEDAVIVLETDKATMEIPATDAGVVMNMNLAVGDKVSEGDLILTLDVEADASAGGDSQSGVSEPVVDQKEEAPVVTDTSSSSSNMTVRVPDLGGAAKVSVIEVSVSEGDAVTEEDFLIVVETDKASMEIPSPSAGTIAKLFAKVGDELNEGDPIAELTGVGGVAESASVKDANSEPHVEASASEKSAPVSQQTMIQQTVASTDTPSLTTAVAEKAASELNQSSGKVHAGPAARKIARELGVDLTLVKGSGPKQRIVKDDVQAFVKAQMQKAQSGASNVVAGSGIPAIKLPDFSQFGAVERQPMSRIHKITAANMSANWLNIPHVTQFDEADITELEAFRKQQKKVAELRNVKLTPLPFILKACAYALAQYPQFNVSLDMDKEELIQKSYIHIGFAVDTPDGLVVPVIRDVDQKGIWQLAEECMALAKKAKDKKLLPSDMQGGCFTISSLGSVGGTAFTPIVNAPEVAILGVSKAAMKPVYDGEGFVPRLMLPLSLSYDHRAVNGADGARFTSLLSELLGDIRNLVL
ncbi:dihydrolipoyllysine-residue acetyltransferase [Litoribrevibacter euphylliae]|uniref:Acetyltransferase component of pyruvate dehydrogenase complex n=1 Tax=Litoribrevibacter euphylliae TaxID=1834034 RepID=A0ABV7HJF9_9GAMM